MNRIDAYVETIERTEAVTVTKPDGTMEEKTEATYEHVLHINIISKTAEQQAGDYGFTEDQAGIMEEMLSSQFSPLMLELLGIDASTGLSPEQLEALYHDLPIGEGGAEIVRLALSRLGGPYSQPKAGQGDYTDCSYFARWCYQQIGINLPRTAAAQAEYCVNSGLAVSPGNLSPGDLNFFSHEENGRFMNITHVSICAGNGYIVDASLSRGQVVYREMIGGDVLYGRTYVVQLSHLQCPSTTKFFYTTSLINSYHWKHRMVYKAFSSTTNRCRKCSYHLSRREASARTCSRPERCY